MAFTQPTKNTANWLDFLRHGNETLLRDMADMTFESVAFNDGTIVKDLTFAELTQQVWTNVNKSSAPTFTNQNKS